MPTKAETRALAFFAGLFAFGAAVRLASQFRHPDARADSGSADALARHVATVDSARANTGGQPKTKRSRAKRVSPTDTPTDSMAPPPPGVPPELAAAAGWFSRPWRKRVTPAPSATRPARSAQHPSVAAQPPAEPNAPPPLVDLDIADESAIEALPGIGPSLARRIVADRAAHGPFGALDGLGRVKGVGAVLQARLAPLVTFSGTARPL